MVLPSTFTNVVPNPAPMPNGLGVETRRNLVPNPDMTPVTVAHTIRVNDIKNPSFENVNPGIGDWTTANQCTVGTVTTTGVVDGTRALTIVPTGASNITYLESTFPRSSTQVPNGTTVELSGTITVPFPQSGTLNADARKLVLYTKNSSTGYTASASAAAPNVPGSYRLSAQITIATGTGVEFFYRLFNGSQNSSDMIYWDSVMLQDVTTINNSSSVYFDGSTALNNTIDGSFYHAWNGVAHNSTSKEMAYAILGVDALAGAWSRWTRFNSWSGNGCASVGWNASSASMVTGQSEDITLPAATQHTFSAYVYRPTGAPTIKLRASGPGMTTVDGGVSTVLNGWERLTVTFTTVTAGVYSISLRNFSAVLATTPSVMTDAWQLETGASATAWFSGNSTTPNLSYQWTGTANNSASTETGLAMPNFVGSNASLTASFMAGANRLGVVPISASTQSKAYIGTGGPGALRMGLLPGKSYYLSARLYLSAALTGTADSLNARNVTVYVTDGGVTSEKRTAISTNAVGTYSHVMKFTVPATATEAYVSLNNGHPTGGGTAYWDQIMIVDSEYTQVVMEMSDLGDISQLSPSNCTLSSTTVTNRKWNMLTPSTASNASYARWVGTGTSLPVKAGRSYTLDHTIRVPGIPAGTLNPLARRVVILMTTPGGVVQVNGPQTPAGATGTYVQTVSFTTPTDMTGIEIQFWNGASTGNGLVQYQDCVLSDTGLTNFAPNYFDGTTYTPADHRVSRWTGSPNASASEWVYRGLWIEGDATVSPPRVRFTAAGLGAFQTSSVSIRRIAGGDTMIVPGWSRKNALDIAVGTDWLVPLNTPTEYQLWVDGSMIDSQTIQFNSSAAWVADPLIPGDAMPIYVVPTGTALQLTRGAMESKDYNGEVDTATVIGSRYPLARASDRQLLQDINLSVQAPANVTSDAFYQMIKDAPILCFRTHPSWGNMPPVIYVACDIKEMPLNRQQGGQFTIWNITGRVVTPITRGPVIAGVTHAQVQANLVAKTHAQIKSVSSGRRWVDIIADPMSLGV